MDTACKPGSGKLILTCFLGFFGLITAVNIGFVYMAVKTNAGVVTESAYEKGLAYNKFLAAARAQPDFQDKMIFKDGVLQWSVKDQAGNAVTGGSATAFLVRPVQAGHDFQVRMTETSPGIYEAKPQFPLHGLWTARLEMTWNSKQYQTTQDFMVK